MSDSIVCTSCTDSPRMSLIRAGSYNIRDSGSGRITISTVVKHLSPNVRKWELPSFLASGVSFITGFMLASPSEGRPVQSL